MHPVSCTNTHHDVTDLVKHPMVKNTKTWISREWGVLNLCFRWQAIIFSRRSGYFCEMGQGIQEWTK